MFKITKYCAYCYDQANQTKIIQKSQGSKIELNNIQDFENEFDEFKFNGKSFSYKGQIFKEGDILGNIKIEYIIPNVHIRVWDIKEGYPFVKVISK